MQVLARNTRAITSLTACDLLYLNPGTVNSADAFLQRPCQINISAEKLKPAFLFAWQLKNGIENEGELSAFYARYRSERDEHALEFRNPNTVRCTDTSNWISFEWPMSLVIKLVAVIANSVARAMRARVESCELITPPGAEPFISVRVCPA